MRAAIVHYWLLNHRGGEKVVEALCRLMPDADIFTLFYDPARVSPIIRERNVRTSFLQPLRAHYRKLLPLMPMALERLDLRDYDLVVSSESGPAKGVITRSTTRHVCYCHTPMRYFWELYPEYSSDWCGSVTRFAMTPFAHYLRLWDVLSANRVDEFIANSQNVRRRISKTYRRESDVIYPPVEVDSFYWRPPGDYYLAVSELVPYKRLDMAVRVFSQSGRKLRVVGEGPEYKRLKRIARGNIEFCGRVSYEELRVLYAGAFAFVQPGEEDFGIASVEALASGKPVVALGHGGACEVVPVSATFGGVLYSDAIDRELLSAVETVESQYHRVSPHDLKRWAARFSSSEFDRKMYAVLFPSVRVLGRRSSGPAPASQANTNH